MIYKKVAKFLVLWASKNPKLFVITGKCVLKYEYSFVYERLMLCTHKYI